MNGKKNIFEITVEKFSKQKATYHLTDDLVNLATLLRKA